MILNVILSACHGDSFILSGENQINQKIHIQQGPLHNIVWYEGNCYTPEIYLATYGKYLTKIIKW